MVWAVTRYRKEILRLIAEVGMGTGAMAVVGGTAVIIAFVTLSAGSLVAIQGLASLGHIGLQTLLGFLAALINVRLVAPVVTGIVLAATVGAGATAELGAMRISEEIDALEVMGVKSMAYLVSTRTLAGLVVIIPLYSLGLIMSFLSPQIVTTVVYGQASRHLRALLPDLPAAQRRVLVVRGGHHHGGRRDAHPLLLRVQRQRRAGRCR